MKLKVLGLTLVLFAGFSAAQTQNSTVDPDPGLVKADSPIYGLEVAFDNALASAGVVSAADVAFERASEVSVAEDRNNTEAVRRAARQFNEAAERADNSQKSRLEQAEQVLNNVSERVPEEASFGISTALENVERAKNRVPDELTSGGGLPDVKLPGGGGDVESPVEGQGR